MRRPGPAIALAVVVAVNLAMLLGVWQARRGAPEATLVLDERELRLGRADVEATTVVLTFARNETRWTDRRLIESLGFDLSAYSLDPRSYAMYRGVLPRRVFVVCELGGEAWKQRLAEKLARAAAPAEPDPDDDRPPSPPPTPEELAQRSSRLVEIEVGTDADALRVRYPDRGRYLVLPAVVGLRAPVPRPGEPAGTFHVRVLQIFPAQVIVPTHLRPALDGLDASVIRPRVTTVRPDAAPDAPEIASAPRYQVVLGVDRSLQPFVMEIRLLESPLRGSHGARQGVTLP